jgi:hypothetical protein
MYNVIFYKNVSNPNYSVSVDFENSDFSTLTQDNGIGYRYRGT